LTHFRICVPTATSVPSWFLIVISPVERRRSMSIALMPSMGYAGLAAASSLGAWLNLALLLWSARRRFGRLGGRTLAASAGRTLVASLAPALWCGVNLWATYPAARASVWLHAAWLVYAIAGGALVFWLASALLGCPERRALLGILPRGRTR